MTYRNTVLISLAIVLLGSCARPFQPLALDTRSYAQSATSEGLTVAYDTFDILTVSNNRRYVKKARKQSLKFLPVRLTNITDDTTMISRSDLQVFREYEMVAAPSLKKLRRVRQVSWPYLLFLLADYTVSEGSDGTRLRLVYFPVGTAYGLTNFTVARVANRKFRQATTKDYGFPVVIPPRKTHYALLPVAYDTPTEQLQIRYVVQD